MTVSALRRGSIAASRVTAATTVAAAIPATAANYASTPDAAANSITGDIDLRVKVNMADWTPASIRYLVHKYPPSGTTNRSYYFRVNTTGVIQFNRSSTGSDTVTATSTVSTGFTDGTTHWVRVTYATASGDTNFYTSDDGTTWTQLGTTVTITAGAIFNSNSPVWLGHTTAGLGGTLYYAEIRTGIDGTVAVKFDPSTDVAIVGTRDPSSFASSSTGETWTMNGSAWDWATS